MKIGKIKKPWMSRNLVFSLEREIIRVSNNIEDSFIYLAGNMNNCKSTYLSNKKTELHLAIGYSRDLAHRLNSCYWFDSNLHPDYEAAVSRVKIMAVSIGKELAKRRQKKDEQEKRDEEDEYRGF